MLNAIALRTLPEVNISCPSSALKWNYFFVSLAIYDVENVLYLYLTRLFGGMGGQNIWLWLRASSFLYIYVPGTVCYSGTDKTVGNTAAGVLADTVLIHYVYKMPRCRMPSQEVPEF